MLVGGKTLLAGRATLTPTLTSVLHLRHTLFYSSVTTKSVFFLACIDHPEPKTECAFVKLCDLTPYLHVVTSNPYSISIIDGVNK